MVVTIPAGSVRSIGSSLVSGLGTRAEVAAGLPVDELEGVGHGVSDVGQAQEQEGYAHYGVQDSDDLARVGFRGDITVTCE